MPHWKKPALLVFSDSRQTLKVKPEQSPPSPPVLPFSGGSAGESSTWLSFQHPPSHFRRNTHEVGDAEARTISSESTLAQASDQSAERLDRRGRGPCRLVNDLQ